MTKRPADWLGRHPSVVSREITLNGGRPVLPNTWGRRNAPGVCGQPEDTQAQEQHRLHDVVAAELARIGSP